MTIIAVDSDQEQLILLTDCLKAAFPDQSVIGFTDPFLAVQFSFNKRVALLFTDIPLRGMDGFVMAEGIRRNNPEVAAYCVTGTEKYRGQAMTEGMDGYLLKPIGKETFRKICRIKANRQTKP